MKHLLLLTLLLASCAGPDAAKRMRGVAAPMERPAMENRVMDVEDSTRAVDRSNRQLAEQVNTLRSASREASSAATRASSEVARLTRQKSATETELMDLSVIMKDVAQRNMFLEENARELKDKISEQEDLIVNLTQTVSTARAASVQKDEENRQLRKSLTDANDEIAEGNGQIALAQHNEARATAKAAEKDEKIASLLIYRRIVWGAVACIVGYLLIRFLLPVAIRAFKPI